MSTIVLFLIPLLSTYSSTEKTVRNQKARRTIITLMASTGKIMEESGEGISTNTNNKSATPERKLNDNPDNGSVDNNNEDAILSPNAMAEAALAAGIERNRKSRDTEKELSQEKTMAMEDANIQQEINGDVSFQNSNAPFQLLSSRDDVEDYGNNRSNVTTKKRKAMEPMVAIRNENQIVTCNSRLDDIWNIMEDGDDAIAQAKKIDLDINSNSGRTMPRKVESALNDTKKILYHQVEDIIQAGLEAFHQNETMARELSQVKELCECRGREVQRLKKSDSDSRVSLSVSALFSDPFKYVCFYQHIMPKQIWCRRE